MAHDLEIMMRQFSSSFSLDLSRVLCSVDLCLSGGAAESVFLVVPPTISRSLAPRSFLPRSLAPSSLSAFPLTY